MRERTFKLKWTGRDTYVEGELTVRVRMATTQGFENTLVAIGLRSVAEREAIWRELLALKPVLQAQDKGIDQDEPVVTRYARGSFRAAIIFGIHRESRRKGLWAFILCRDDEVDDVLWKVFHRVATA